MEAWVWLTAYLVGFALLQAVLYRYFRRGDSSGERATNQPGDHTGTRADAGQDSRNGSPAETRTDPGPDARRSTSDTDSVHCRNCGALNERDSIYTYCRQCTQPLN